MKRKLTTWMLLIGALLLGGFILIFERGSETSGQQDRLSRTVFSIYPDSIDRIAMERDGVQIECVKENGIWRMSKPVSVPVDSGVVDKMIAGMARVERGEIITAKTLQERGLSPSDYGFDQPRAQIVFKNNRGTFTWLIGRDAPLGQTLYVMSSAGGDIIAAPRTLLDLVPQDPSWIRDHTLFTGETPSVRGIDLRRDNGFLQLRQTENNGWQMQQPHTGKADLQAVHAFIEKILSARIGSFITDEKTDLTAYGLENPSVELTVFTQDERIQTLQIGKPLPENPKERYAKRIESDSVFTVPTDWSAGLEIDATGLRSRLLTDLQPERITSLRLTRGEQQVELVQTDHSWQVIRPARWEADPKRVNDLLKILTTASIEQFVDTPNDEQIARMKAAPWEAVLTAGTKTCTLRISAPGTNDLRLVQYNDDSSLYAVSSDITQESFADPLFYRSRVVLSVNPAEIQKISVQSEQSRETFVKSESGSFVSETQNLPVQPGVLTDLMWALNHLQADRYVAFNPSSLDMYGLLQPSTELTVTLAGTNTIGHVVLLGSPTEGGRFAMLQGQNIVFVLPDETVRTLTHQLIRPAENKTTRE